MSQHHTYYFTISCLDTKLPLILCVRMHGHKFNTRNSNFALLTGCYLAVDLHWYTYIVMLSACIVMLVWLCGISWYCQNLCFDIFFIYYNTLVLLNVIQWSHRDNLYLPFESLAYFRFQYPGVLSDKHESDQQS